MIQDKKHLIIIAGLTLSLSACQGGPSPTSPSDSQPSTSVSTLPVASPLPIFPGGEPTVAPSVSPSTAPTAVPTSTPSVSPTAAPTPAPSLPPNAIPSLAPQPLETPLPGVLPGLPAEVVDLRENFFKNYGINPFVEASSDPVSTFAADVDTASFTIARSYINNRRQLPPPDSVRTEEYLNYFNYQYPQPLNGAFAIQTDIAPSYFGDDSSKLLRIGLQGREVLARNRKAARLTFVIDVSGSMNRENRLGLAKQSIKLLLDQLKESDQVGIVVFGTEARVLLGHTPVSSRSIIEGAIEQLRPEGSTHTEAGLKLGYAQARQAFLAGAINRVMLVSDGVANVGAKGPEEILAQIRIEKEQGITLTTLGFGLEGFNDALMEQLANQGDGNFAYIDTLEQAKRVLVEQLTNTLQVIAKDVKIQVNFNPELVEQYRLLGYENRDIADDDFTNDAVDAGEVGSNHSVTALYEVRFKPDQQSGEVAQVKVRYQDIDDKNQIKEISKLVFASEVVSFSNASASLKLATVAAEFAEILRGSVFAEGSSLAEVLSLAQEVQQSNPSQDIQELVSLLQQANHLKNPTPGSSLGSLVTQSQNPKKLPQWQPYLIQQLGGLRAPSPSPSPSAQPMRQSGVFDKPDAVSR